ncbi:DUF4012 domain-containing protein [Patescibacteria group bacterium]|nr:DUF4012 domain-containing protein [Patescibacteria group bacterium]
MSKNRAYNFDGLSTQKPSFEKKSIKVQKQDRNLAKEDLEEDVAVLEDKELKKKPYFIADRSDVKEALTSIRPRNRVVDLRSAEKEVEQKPDSSEKKELPEESLTEKKPESFVKSAISFQRGQGKLSFIAPDFVLNRAEKVQSNKFKKKSLAVFTLVCLLFSFGVQSLAYVGNTIEDTKSKVLGSANVAYQYADSAAGSLGESDFDMASYKFAVASERFFSSKQDIDNISRGLTQVLAIIPGGNQVTSGENLLLAGGNFATAGEYAAKAMEPFSSFEDSFEAIKSQEGEQERKTSLDGEDESLTDALTLSTDNLRVALSKLKEAEKNLESVNTDKLPADIAPKIKLIKDKTPGLIQSLEYFLSYTDTILEILGSDTYKRYLILFQNNAELRATGGFIGTYGLMDLNEGKITNLKVEGPYNIDGQLTENIISPEAMHLINSRFYMRDANWFPDFPTSARKVSSLHEKAGGPSVDGVMAFNAEIIIELLRLTGPVEIPEYGLTITAENFREETQREVELSYDKELNRPKKFISDLIPKVLKKVLELEKKDWLQVVMLMTSLLDNEEIMIYFFDKDLQKRIEEMGWDGALKQDTDDYLNVVISNIGGGKTDAVIDQNIEAKVDILPDGSIINEVNLTRTHNGDKNNFWTRVKNVSYVRFYVPKGSELLEAEGFDTETYNQLVPNDEGAKPDPLLAETEGQAIIHDASETRVYQETGKTVFGNFMNVEAGKAHQVKLRYKLPFKIDLSLKDAAAEYSFLFEKQSGAKPSEVNLSISYPMNYFVSWDYLTEADMQKSFRRLQGNFVLDKDKIFAVIFSK